LPLRSGKNCGEYILETGKRAEMLEVKAPAKINLTLEVLTRMEDGFHGIRSIAQTINLCDTLLFQPSDGDQFSCGDGDWSSGQSLIGKTVTLLRDTVGCSRGVSIDVIKEIPLLSGLGGDSSDAAATLVGLNRLWCLRLSRHDMLSMAERLGSDVSFFLYGGTALLESRGELVTPLPSFPHTWVVLLLPPVARIPGKTRRLYGNIKVDNYSKGAATERLVALLNQGGDIASSTLFNVFDDFALDSFPGLKPYWDRFLDAGAGEIHLAGSGPVLFSLVKNRTRGEKIQRRLEKLGVSSYLTDTRDRSGDILTG
jgi:4-diphosphocytidyl-2-C-methyl-D-erythritol kinase